MIREEQLRGEPERRSDRAARRRDQHNARHFKVALTFLALCVPPFPYYCVRSGVLIAELSDEANRKKGNETGHRFREGTYH